MSRTVDRKLACDEQGNPCHACLNDIGICGCVADCGALQCTGSWVKGVSPNPACPDGGTCHHCCSAATTCFRVDWAGPLSGVFPGDAWPAEVRAAHTATDGGL